MKKLLLWLVRVSPLWLLYAVAWVLGYLAYYSKNNQRHIAEVNLGIAYPNMSLPARNRLVRRVMVETVKNILESVKFWQMPARSFASLVKEAEGMELLQGSQDNQQPVILLAPHLGNWEIINLYLSPNYTLSGLYRPQKSAWLDKLMREGRSKFGTRTFPADTSGVKSLMRCLKQNHIIFILPDQNPGRGAGVFADFYSKQALSPVLPVKLAARSDAKVLLTFAERLPYARGFKLHIVESHANYRHSDVSQACSEMNHDIQKLIDTTPSQYWWGYSRYRHRPPGEAPLYQKD